MKDISCNYCISNYKYIFSIFFYFFHYHSMFLTDLINKERMRQEHSLELIASENYVSQKVMLAYSNVFTNKYSEWYPGKRYYGGNEIVDQLETYAQWLALKIFWLDAQWWWVNVQPLSWSVANCAVYTGLLNPGDTILAMDLNAWWHLTHGMKLNASGKYFNIIHYGVDEKWIINYDQLLQLALTHKPKLIVAWFSSYPRSINRKKFLECKRELSKEWNHCYLMADIAHIAGLIAWWTLLSPFDEGFDIITTTTHKTLRWPRWALIYYSLSQGKELEQAINRWVFPWIQGWPFDHVLVAKAQAFLEILDPQNNRSLYCQKVLLNAKVLSNELISLGRTLTTWWTDNHLMVVDVTHNNWEPTWLSGKSAEQLLESIWLSINKQLLPHDPRTPQDPSWIRIGTPAITTRGLNEDDVKSIAHIIHECLLNLRDKHILHENILKLCNQYPLRYS